MTLQRKRDLDHDEAQKRPLTKSKHGGRPEARKFVRSYVLGRDLDYIGYLCSQQQQQQMNWLSFG
jgi:hypothetical protein